MAGTWPKGSVVTQEDRQVPATGLEKPPFLGQAVSLVTQTFRCSCPLTVMMRSTDQVGPRGTEANVHTEHRPDLKLGCGGQRGVDTLLLYLLVLAYFYLHNVVCDLVPLT